jgi:hypothetical protein
MLNLCRFNKLSRCNLIAIQKITRILYTFHNLSIFDRKKITIVFSWQKHLKLK